MLKSYYLALTPASGPDEIPCCLLKELFHELAPLLTAIFRQGLDSGILPKVWSKAFITPVFKKGSRCEPENYRLVPLTCVSCKILEHIRLHLDRCEILTPLTMDLDLNFLAKLNFYSLSKMTILDFSKAFDIVPHERLWGKMKFYGINGPIL